jgi:diadenosine tetraphosphate (Ap4A) HIT family hydrolase
VLIYETPNFIVESAERPFVPREEGGHIRIRIKDESIMDRTKLSISQAKEYMRLSMVVGEALEKAMNLRGVKVVKINYQDMGNWAYKEGRRPFLHYHIFGRVFGALKQPLPESVYLPDRGTGFYEGFTPLNQGDVDEIKKQIEEVSSQEKYLLDGWGLE